MKATLNTTEEANALARIRHYVPHSKTHLASPQQEEIPTSRASLTASAFSGRASVLFIRSSRVLSQEVSRSK